MRHDININFHDVLKIGISSDRDSYRKYFMAELPSGFFLNKNDAFPDIEMVIGDNVPIADSGDICIEGCFKKIYRYRCLIRDISCKHTKVYFSGPLWGCLLPMSLDVIFFHNQILDPIIYYKMLTKNILMLHASAVGHDGKVYLFSGASGAGKTSLAFRFINIGYRFLGDDAIFVSSGRTAFSYPKRVHYFSYLKKKNPFLKISAGKAILSAVREAARNILQVIFNENFYLSTRMNINSLFPDALYMDKGSLDTIFLIKSEKPVDFKDAMLSSDARDFLLNVIIKERPDMMIQIEKMEASITSGIMEKTKVVIAALDDIKADKP